ncbi:DUF6493 family protein [Asanoa ferruginea]|uniref:DUF6493 family protein n=1 Tax=Asanoa ferruginea TaxID=53367 RepID=UPI000E23FF2C|nr:DUF6493 family protein [Asanoa ferruginea]
MLPLDQLLNELRDLPAKARPPVWVLRRFFELGEVSEPPTVEPPRWLRPAVVEALESVAEGWPQSDFFGAVRMLERFGLVTLEHDDTYVLAMVSCLGDPWEGSVRADALRRDPELRDLVWRVFEVEGGGEVSLANVDKFSAPDASWTQTFLTLVADGTLPRDRVLRSCLQALGRDFSAYRAGWFSGTYRGLEPTAAECVADQPLLLRLLHSTVPATVSFAVRHLTVVAKAGALDDEDYVAECAAAMVVPAKSTALGAINLAAAVAGRRPDLAPAVAEAIGAGLGHAHRDVQSRALAVLRSLAANKIVEARLDELEPSVRRAAAEWLDVPAAPSPPVETAAAVSPAGPAAAATVAERGARLLAGHLDAMDVEMFLAALAVNDTAGLDALHKQAAKILSDPRWQGSLRQHLAGLIAAKPVTGPDTFLRRRLAEVGHVLKGRRAPAPLLATPTDPAGWLDPRVFVDRLAANPDPPPFDLAAALLRLAPEGRADALRSARTLPGEPGAVARYALGGEPAELTTPALWVAAARARAPLADDPHLLAAGLDQAGQGRPATYGLLFEPEHYQYEGRARTYYRPSLEVTPPGAVEQADQPTVVAVWVSGPGTSSVWQDLDPDWIPWHAHIWPHDAEPFFAVRLDEVLRASTSYPMVTYGTTETLDALVTHPGRLGPMAAATLAASLSASEVRHRVLAAEACARLVPAARITAAELATAMAGLARHCTATRWATTLRDAARIGPDAGSAVIDVLDDLLPRLGADQPGLHALLETRYEEAVRLGRRTVSGPATTWLQALAGSSKAARTARLILAEATAT